MHRAHPLSPNFLELPSEIRNRVYAHLLVDEDTYTESSDSKFVRDGISGILIRELYPGFYKAGSRRRSYLTPDWDPLHHQQRRTTYTLDSQVDLQLFYVCRQIYKEASYIFYARNRFYVDTIDTLVPFLEDRPCHARDLIKTISIPVPYGVQRDENGEDIPRCCNVKASTFTYACACLAARPELTANLKQFDLRAWDYYRQKEYNGVGSLDISTLRISTHCAEQAARMADPGIMTMSSFDWHHSAMAGPEGHAVFEPLPDHLRRKLQRFRDKSQLEDNDDNDDSSGDNDGDDDDDFGEDDF